METNDAEELAALENLFLTLADKTRLRLLALMAAGPVTVGALVEGLGDSQPKVSRHLAYMREHGYVSTRRDGKCIYYGIKEPQTGQASLVLASIVGALSGSVANSTHRTRERHFVEPIRSDADGEQRFAEEGTITSPKDLLVEEKPEPYDWSDHSEYQDRQTEEELEVFLL